MKMIKKIGMMFLIIIVVFFSCYACNSEAGFREMLKDAVNGEANNASVDKVRSVSQSVITIAQVIGVGIAVIMLVVLAMKYMVSAPNEKAEIKKHAVVYIIGAVVLFGSVGILEIIKNLADVVNE